MKKLSEIPDWMEKYIPLITDNGCKTSNQMRVYLDVIAGDRGCHVSDVVVMQLNIKIDLLQKLHDKNII